MEQYEKPIMELLFVNDDVILTSTCDPDSTGCNTNSPSCSPDNEGPMVPF